MQRQPKHTAIEKLNYSTGRISWNPSLCQDYNMFGDKNNKITGFM